MVTTTDRFNPEVGETERIVEEFKQRVIQSLERDRINLKESAEKDAKLILSKAYEESTSITAKANEESKQIINKAQEQANREMESILNKARERAEQIVTNADEICKRDAKEKTRKEIDYLLKTAREEATKVMAKTLQTAKEESNVIIANAKSEAEKTAQQTVYEAELEAKRTTKTVLELKQKAEGELLEAQKKAAEEAVLIVNAAREKARQTAETEASSILSEAREKAQKEKEQMLAQALVQVKRTTEEERVQLMAKATKEAEDIVSAAKNQIRLQFEQSSRLMLDIQQQMQKVMGATGLDLNKPEPKTATIPDATVSEPILHKVDTISTPELKVNFTPVNKEPPADLSQHLKEETKNEKQGLAPEPARLPEKEPTPVVESRNIVEQPAGDEGSRVYQGKLKIDIAPPVDKGQVANLEQFLSKTPGLNLKGKGVEEDGSAWVEIETIKPSPLLDILKKIPVVKDVVGAKSYIIISLRAKQTV